VEAERFGSEGGHGLGVDRIEDVLHGAAGPERGNSGEHSQPWNQRQ
jgi:hypothetical protein